MKDITVVCWKWKPMGWKSAGTGEYTSDHVNTFCHMIKRHLHIPYNIICITDDPQGITECETMPIWEYPSAYYGCMKRTRLFSKEISKKIGGRIFSMDIDCVIVNDITPLFNSDKPFTIWTVPNMEAWPNRNFMRKVKMYCGAFWGFDAGTMTHAWDELDLSKMWYYCTLTKKGKIDDRQKYLPALSSGYTRGSEQAYIGYCLNKYGVDYHEVTNADGLYSINHNFNLPAWMIRKVQILPQNSRIIFFNGPRAPWQKPYCDWKFVKNNYF